MRKRVIRAGEIEIEDSEGARAGSASRTRISRSCRSTARTTSCARFGVQPDGSAGLAIADDEGKVRATFGLFSDGSASMAMVDRNGKVRAKFGLGTEGSPTLALRNKEGQLGFVYWRSRGRRRSRCRTRTARCAPGSGWRRRGRRSCGC